MVLESAVVAETQQNDNYHRENGTATTAATGDQAPNPKP